MRNHRRLVFATGAVLAGIGQAQAQSFDVVESGFQPVTIGDAYHGNNLRDVVEITPTSTNIWIDATQMLFQVPRTAQPVRALLSGINDDGEVAGIGEDETGPYVWIWQGGQSTALGRPKDPASGLDSVPDFLFMANGSRVAGLSAGGSWTWGGTDFTWLFTPDLGVGDSISYNAAAQAINNTGRVAGYALTNQSTRMGATWSNGMGESLATPVGFFTATPVSINDSRQVVGTVTGGAGTLGVLWEADGSIISLGATSFPTVINNRGEVIGTREVVGITDAYIWRNNVSTRITDLLTGNRYTVISAEDLNDQGEVLAWVFDREDNANKLAWLIPTGDDPNGRPNPPSSVVPLIKRSDDGTFDGDEFVTSDTNSRNSKMTFEVSGSSPLSTVNIFADDILLGRKRGSFGVFKVTTDGRDSLADGTYVLMVSQTVNGQESIREPFFNLTIDTTPPSPPSVPVLAPQSDTGASNSDNITAAKDLTFSGSAEPGSTVRIRIKKKLAKGEAVTDTLGRWSITIKSAKGAKDYSAVATDPAGNSSDPGPALRVEVATKKIGKPKKLDMIDADKAPGFGTKKRPATSNPSPTIEGKGKKGASVRLIVDGLDAGVGNVASNGRWEVTINRVLQPGEHQVVAEQFDAAGNVSKPSGSKKFEVLNAGSAPSGSLAAKVVHVIGWIGDDAHPASADVDGDGNVDADDVARLLAASP